ncbi:MAG: hypothetical protein EXS33_00025 [Pedosphaera sp.]|nr:hypothetical protein [Pedosphaera sp.]
MPLCSTRRGATIKEAALLRALGEKWIAGAALDTHYAYPLPASHPLWRFPPRALHAAYLRFESPPSLQRKALGIFGQNVVASAGVSRSSAC